MTPIREFLSGIGSPSVCEACTKELARLVIEGFPAVNEHISLCQTCAAVAFSEHPKLLVSAVVTLILRDGKGVTVQS
jgi:hypothetical protein